MEFFTPATSLWSLFGTAFIAATLLPASSEVVLFAVLKLHPGLYFEALAVATAGNTAGGMSTYLIGRLLAARKPLAHLAAVERYGAPLMLFAWAPLVGDALCVAAGWLKLNWIAVAVFQALGRFARYWVIAQGAMI